MRILIVADNAVTANGIKLEMRHATGFHIVGFLSGRRSCELIAAQEKPDVVLLDDMHSSEMTLERIAELRRAVPDAKIVLLTLCMEANWLAEASEAGIHAAVTKMARPGGIGTLVREIVQGNVFHAFASGVTRSVPKHHELTARELEILQLAAAGDSNRRIAERLWVTEQTVKFHLSNVYRKLGVSNRTEASHLAHMDGLVAGAPNAHQAPVRPLPVSTSPDAEPSLTADERAA
jgi:DNA-binding NarL/FixJ family response regulator